MCQVGNSVGFGFVCFLENKNDLYMQVVIILAYSHSIFSFMQTVSPAYVLYVFPIKNAYTAAKHKIKKEHTLT